MKTGGLMVRICGEKDREILIRYLKQEAVYNTFMLADISDFGFDEEFQTVYMDEEEGKIKGVYLCFYKNLILYSKENEVNLPFLENLFSGFVPDVVMGKTENIDCVREVLKDYTGESKVLYLLEETGKLVDGAAEILEAQPEDADDIFDFLQNIPEMRQLYTSKEMIVDRIQKNCGTHYIIKEGGQLVAHANSAAESDFTVMIGGVATAQSRREQKLASQLVSRLCCDILEKGKQPCLFCSREENHNLYVRIGFKKAGLWGTLVKAEKIPENILEIETHEKKTHRLPSYIPIYNRLYEDIVKGVYQKGSILPSENVLSEKYHVSRNTLRQALTILYQDGYIYKKQGKGTYVSYDSEKKQKDRIYNFLTEDALEEIVRITIDHNFGPPTQIARKKLELKDEEEVLASNNVYESEQGPIGQSFLQIPLRVLSDHRVDTESKAELLTFMNDTIYHLAAGVEMTIQMMEADEQVVPYLKVQPGTVLLHFEQLLFDKNHLPIARIKYYFCQGKYQIQCRW